MTKIEIEITEDTLKDLVLNYLAENVTNFPLTSKDIDIQVKSKQNYKSEWESASFRARISLLK